MIDQPTAREEPPAAPLVTGAERPTQLPEPSGERVDEPPQTGDPRVDEALAGLAGIAGQPPAEHVAVYEEVHRRLQDALADLDDDS
jgi:hypothetical protein